MAERSERELLIRRIEDAIKLCIARSSPTFVGFLGESEQATVNSYLASGPFLHEYPNAKYCFFGGVDDAERKIFAALPDWANEDDIAFPITAIRAEHNDKFSLTHRDYLGAIMALGLVRAKIGDIIVDESGAYIMAHTDVAEHIISQLDKIGRVGVKLYAVDTKDITHHQEYEDIRLTVASPRLDCVVAALCGVSREKSSSLISGHLVILNGVECTETDKKVGADDRLSVRRVGKFEIVSTDTLTKKGRNVLFARKKL